MPIRLAERVCEHSRRRNGAITLEPGTCSSYLSLAMYSPTLLTEPTSCADLQFSNSDRKSSDVCVAAGQSSTASPEVLDCDLDNVG